MRRCENCSRPLSYKSILNSILFSFKEIECPTCKVVHYVKISTKLILVVAIAVPFLIFTYLASKIGYYTIAFYIIWLIIIFSIMPYIASYKTETQKLNTLKK